ncbi:MAG TPA: methyltransferase domain-containing protein [Rhizomicrobium sp.]|jgi:ubiquinone/menaquinone biosynthesis C-methylase UbiE|nr:methyltransferase domain-containing protein [Rhizomicrobium sp.]
MAPRTSALTYAAAQAVRVAFYGAHYLVARVLARDAFTKMPRPDHPIPTLPKMLAAMRKLFARDWKNVREGLYPAPVDGLAEMRRAMTSLKFLADIPRVAKRQKRHEHSEVKGADENLPRYFRQNFHFQTGGYLSDDSAKLYDFQVEALFAGTADAMRRQAFVPIAKALKNRQVGKLTLLDVGCGTGTFLQFVKTARPKLKMIALDLSQPYLERARKNLRGFSDVEFVQAPAEDMPLQEASVDFAVSIYLFHELPPKVRAAVAQEIARVLKPGGIFVLADSIQYGDADGFDGLLDAFPHLLHEPYFSTYAKADFDTLFANAGLERIESSNAYLTKVSVFQKVAEKKRAPKLKAPAKPKLRSRLRKAKRPAA